MPDRQTWAMTSLVGFLAQFAFTVCGASIQISVASTRQGLGCLQRSGIDIGSNDGAGAQKRAAIGAHYQLPEIHASWRPPKEWGARP